MIIIREIIFIFIIIKSSGVLDIDKFIPIIIAVLFSNHIRNPKSIKITNSLQS